MKKILTLAAIIFSLACTFGVAQASGDTAVVLIGGSEFKTPDYYKIIKSAVHSKAKVDCEVGDDVQKKYQRLILERYDVSKNNNPNKNDLVEFVSRYGYRQVLFLVVDSTLDSQNNAHSRQKNRVSIEINAYLCDRTDLVDTASSTRDDDSKTSVLRARKGAFKKSVNEVVKSLHW